MISHSVDLDFFCFFVPSNTTSFGKCGAAIVSLGAELAHAHDGFSDVAYLESNPDFASIVKFHRHCSLTILFQLSTSGYQIGILARLDLNPFQVLRGTHMLVRTIVHQDAYSVPILGLMGWLSVSNCCRDVSSFVLLTCILYVRVILGIILGNSRDLTCRGDRTSCRCYRRLFQLFRLF